MLHNIELQSSVTPFVAKQSPRNENAARSCAVTIVPFSTVASLQVEPNHIVAVARGVERVPAEVESYRTRCDLA